MKSIDVVIEALKKKGIQVKKVKLRKVRKVAGR